MSTEWKPEYTDRQKARHKLFKHMLREAENIGMTQKDVADHIGVSHQTVRAWSMETPPRIPTLRAIQRFGAVLRGDDE